MDIQYLPEIKDDLKEIGQANARKVKQVIEDRFINGEPHKSGKPLRKELAGCRRIRTGNIRIIYRVDQNVVSVLIIAIGLRRDSECYAKAEERL